MKLGYLLIIIIILSIYIKWSYISIKDILASKRYSCKYEENTIWWIFISVILGVIIFFIYLFPYLNQYTI